MKNNKFETLFLCTGNSCRSVMAEALLQRHGRGDFLSFSAGSQPKGKVNPLALTVMEKNNHPTDSLRSKSWDEFTSEEYDLDIVITVCDNAAGEVCPIWPGQPMTAHWSFADPDRPDLDNEQQLQLMEKTYWEIDFRIKLLTSLPIDKLDSMSLKDKLDEIGRTTSSS